MKKEQFYEFLDANNINAEPGCNQRILDLYEKLTGHNKAITSKIKDGLKAFFDITVLDHIILSGEDDKYFSFVDEGLL